MPNEHVPVHLHAIALPPIHKGIRFAEVITVDRRVQAFPFEFVSGYNEAALTRYNVTQDGVFVDKDPGVQCGSDVKGAPVSVTHRKRSPCVCH